MELKEYRFDEVTINFDKKRVPLSGAQREKRQGKYRYYGAQGVIDHIDDYIFDGAYLLIAEDGENLKSKKQNIAQVVEGQFWVNNHAHIVQGNELCDTRYLCYLLNSMDLSGYVTGSAQPKLSQANLNAVTLFLPSISIQKKIVEYLYMFDKKIAVNQQINDNLQQQLSAIFREWFIDASESAEWPRGTFADLIDHTISGDWGKDAPTGNYTEMVYCIRGADIPEVKAGNKGKMPTRYILPKNYAAKQLVDGDIVVEISGGSPSQSTGRAAAVSTSLLARYDKGMVCTNFCKALKPITGYSMYVYHYWQHLYDLGVFFSYENGTTGIKNLDINGFIETEPISLAPVELVMKFDAFCQSIFSKVYANGLENEQLALVRDTLLPKLMSGEIDVSDIQL